MVERYWRINNNSYGRFSGCSDSPSYPLAFTRYLLVKDSGATAGATNGTYCAASVVMLI
jgi:hypothetical protein